jgi:hypothetical protein
MGIAASAAIEYNAFWMLNSLVNQYKWHCVGLYNKLKPSGEPRLHYTPIVWSSSRLVYTPADDEVIAKLKTFVAPFPGISAFGTGIFSTFQTYLGKDTVQNDTVQKGGGAADALMRGAQGALVYTVVRSFQLLNAVWNEFRWYLLELRRIRQDPEVTGMEHTYISTAASGPMGKLIRGKQMFRPIDDPVLNGLENDPPLQKFIDEIYSGHQEMRRASSNIKRNTRRRISSERRIKRSRSRSKNRF